jgi:hypothetical protein
MSTFRVASLLCRLTDAIWYLFAQRIGMPPCMALEYGAGVWRWSMALGIELGHHLFKHNGQRCRWEGSELPRIDEINCDISP